MNGLMILKASKPTVRGAGAYASKIILAKRENHSNGFSTHMVVFPDDRADNTPFMINGHYDLTLPEAVADFEARVKLG